MRNIHHLLRSWPPRCSPKAANQLRKGSRRFLSKAYEDRLLRWWQAVVAKEVLYMPAIVAVKTSILLLYHRIFADKGLNRSFNIWLWGAGLFTLAYSIVGVFAVVFHCTPTRSLWDPTVTGKCIDFDALLIVISSCNIGADILVLCLPMPLLWQLKMPAKRKAQLTGIFLLGGL